MCQHSVSKTRQHSIDRVCQHSVSKPRQHSIARVCQHSVSKSRQHSIATVCQHSVSKTRQHSIARVCQHSVSKPRQHSIARVCQHSVSKTRQHSIPFNETRSRRNPIGICSRLSDQSPTLNPSRLKIIICLLAIVHSCWFSFHESCKAAINPIRDQKSIECCTSDYLPLP